MKAWNLVTKLRLELKVDFPGQLVAFPHLCFMITLDGFEALSMQSPLCFPQKLISALRKKIQFNKLKYTLFLKKPETLFDPDDDFIWKVLKVDFANFQRLSGLIYRVTHIRTFTREVDLLD